MSLGYGVGNMILVTQLAWKCVKNAREACGKHNEFTREVMSLHTLLNRIQREESDPNSLFNHPDESRDELLKPLIENCDIVLSEIDTILRRYATLGAGKHPKGKKIWQKIKFGNDEMQDLIQLWQKMAHHTQALHLFCSLMSVTSQGRVEQFIRSTGGGMQRNIYQLNQAMGEKLAQILRNTQKPERYIFTNFPDDNPGVWKEFRRKLRLDGYTSSFIQENLKKIIRGIKGLDGPGILGESLEPRSELRQWQPIDGPARWQLFQSAWQDDLSKDLAHIAAAANLIQPEALHDGFFQPSRLDSAAPELAKHQLAIAIRSACIVQDDAFSGDPCSTADTISSQEQFTIKNSSGSYKNCLRRLSVSNFSSTQQSVRFVRYVCTHRHSTYYL